MLTILLLGFAVFAAAVWFFDDTNIKKLGTFGAAVCVLVFVVLIVLHAAGVATTPLWP